MTDNGWQGAERALRNGVTGPAATRALRELARSTQPRRAVPWCRRLRQEAERLGDLRWAASISLAHAEALLRLGDLEGAERHGCAARHGAADGPLEPAVTAVLAEARTAMGRYGAAAHLLERPVRPHLLLGADGLTYRRARGRHALATRRPHAALADFLEAGRLARELRADHPAALPWRSDAALALARIGEPGQAERLAGAQLAGPGGELPWVRGLALRARAAAAPTARARTGLLEQAAEAMRQADDRVEQAHALADLGRALREQGLAERARTTLRRAWSLAHACGAEALCEEVLPGLAVRRQPSPAPPDAAGEPARGAARLSASEQRVAALAAHGYTNREIARRLYVTVSTVEQHLTRVYRKLAITRRQELPVDWAPQPADVA
ncbi:LuxR C-terminal-related transcriptional regulator [Streptomyces sp. TRM70308]|uniref:LuxR family transcriptional regulator n=1 Tax=Streptomyces TaxID=1883 RepID=UPI00224968A9|nr:LuxR family transcriptional regulator [Streptomyces sp. JHD 1]MCX2970983.1 LuxR C-terminal-related transcriptional regulator [Streptomyces sp. JHD 1]